MRELQVFELRITPESQEILLPAEFEFRGGLIVSVRGKINFIAEVPVDCPSILRTITIAQVGQKVPDTWNFMFFVPLLNGLTGVCIYEVVTPVQGENLVQFILPPANSSTELWIPNGARTVLFGLQSGTPSIWAYVNPLATKERRMFVRIPLGGQAPENGRRLGFAMLDSPYGPHYYYEVPTDI